MRDDFDEFFSAEYGRLVRFVMCLGARRQEAEDAAAIACIKVCDEWTKIRTPAAWVRTVAQRTYFRQRERLRREAPLEDAALDGEDVMDGFNLAEHVAGADRVLAALRHLPPKQQVVMAWAIDGYQPSEIAELMNVAPDSVRQSLKRAREHLRVLLAVEGDDRGEEGLGCP